MYLHLNYISKSVAEIIAKALNANGIPTEDRVLIFSPKDQDTTQGSIIIPGTVKEGMPRKGVIVQVGHISETYKSYQVDSCKIGTLVTYGLYAGKEIEFDPNIFPEDIRGLITNGKNIFTVLSLNEIVYSEYNK